MPLGGPTGTNGGVASSRIPLPVWVASLMSATMSKRHCFLMGTSDSDGKRCDQISNDDTRHRLGTWPRYQLMPTRESINLASSLPGGSFQGFPDRHHGSLGSAPRNIEPPDVLPRSRTEQSSSVKTLEAQGHRWGSVCVISGS